MTTEEMEGISHVSGELGLITDSLVLQWCRLFFSCKVSKHRTANSTHASFSSDPFISREKVFHVKNKRARIHSSHLSDMNSEMVTDPQFLRSLKKYLCRVPQWTRQTLSLSWRPCVYPMRAGSTQPSAEHGLSEWPLESDHTTSILNQLHTTPVLDHVTRFYRSVFSSLNWGC